MDKMFDGSDGSDTEVNFKATNEYAKNYDKWRQKELLNSLKTKYQGDLNTDDETSSSDDDDSDIELPDKVEMDFLKTLSSLKNKDPKIYDENVKFFDDTPIDPTVKKKKKEQPMFLKDYERQMLLEHGEKVFEEEEDQEMPENGFTYVQEQENIRKKLKSALEEVDNNDDENFGGMFQTRVKTKAEEEKEEANYKQWLKGQKENLKNAEDETSLKPLKDHWSDPNLEDGEKFLRDYILNNRFKESSDSNYVPTYDEIIHEDEAFSDDENNVDKQEEFEHKFNYRFEEPDQEFLKRYPRTVESSLRKTDDRRKTKRHELKERKAKEKQEKMEDIRKLKEIKRKEIEEKIKKLKEITGNTEVAFADHDIDEDFDPAAHDKRMQALFDDEFYTGEEGDEKPEFPELDDELEIERWDKMHKEEINKPDDDYDGPHAEDEDFNMDCDYDPSVSAQNELMENSKGKKKRRRKSKFAKAVKEAKPIFDPNDKSYEEYLDEYYKLDCEDIVSGIPCRFKYREVAPNSFGLTIEEILTANDKELNRWCSIKKAMQYRPDHVERYDQIAYSKKAENEALKRKILPSLYAQEKEKPPKHNKRQNEYTATSTSTFEETEISQNTTNNEKPSKKLKKKRNPEFTVTSENAQKTAPKIDNKPEIETTDNVDNDSTKKSKKAKKKRNISETNHDDQLSVKKMKLNENSNDNQVEETAAKTEKVKSKKAKKANGNQVENVESPQQKQPIEKQNAANNDQTKPKNKKAKKQNTENGNNLTPNKNNNNNGKQQGKQNSFKGKSNGKNKQNTSDCGLSDARLQAFGIKPKKFKNKLKYGNNNST